LNLTILKDLNCSPYIIKHSEAVLKKALSIYKDLEDDLDVDRDLVEAGAILHDVGRTRTQGILHGILGAEILKEHGFSPELVKITERHIGAGIPKDEAILLGLPPKDYLPITLEEKIVAHADNLIHGTEEVSICFVLDKWRKSMGEGHPSLDRLIELHGTFFEWKLKL